MKSESTNESVPSSPPEPPRYELEHQANQMRARLLGTIDELDRRRHELFNLGVQLRRHASDILSAAGGLLFGVGATAAILIFRHERHVRRIRHERVRALARWWHYPERIAERSSAVGTTVRMVLVALATMATTTLASRQIDRLRRRPRLPAHPSEPLGL